MDNESLYITTDFFLFFVTSPGCCRVQEYAFVIGVLDGKISSGYRLCGSGFNNGWGRGGGRPPFSAAGRCCCNPASAVTNCTRIWAEKVSMYIMYNSFCMFIFMSLFTLHNTKAAAFLSCI
jgi:hypothetical protein